MNANIWRDAPAQAGTNWNVNNARTGAAEPSATRGTPPPKKYARIPLRTVGEVQSEAGRIYRLARSGQMDSSECSRLASVLALIARMIEAGELEKRISALEERSV